jgi:hypothetical protein
MRGAFKRAESPVAHRLEWISQLRKNQRKRMIFNGTSIALPH